MPFVIDVDPVAFTLFGVVPVRWYGLILVLAAAVTVWFAMREGRRRGIDAATVTDATWWVAIASLVGGRALYVLQNEPASLVADPAAMAPLGIPLHPTQAYEAILLAALFVGLWLGRARLARVGAGALAAAYLLGLATIRFGLKTAQWLGLGLAILAVILLVAARRHARSLPTRSLQLEAIRP